MSVTEAHKRASYKYNASKDSITIRPEKDQGAAIRAAAATAGKSLQGYILEAVAEKMERDGRRMPPPQEE